MFRAVGCETDYEIAAVVGCSHRTVRRARTGQLGEVFIANTLAALGRHADRLAAQGMAPTFDALFALDEAA